MSRNPERILVVENVDAWRSIIVDRLRGIFPEMEIDEAASVDEAREIMRRLGGLLRAVFTDLHLDPEGYENGDKVIAHIISEHTDVPVAVISGTLADATKKRLAEDSNVPFFGKDSFAAPDNHRLIRRVRRFVDSTPEIDPDLPEVLAHAADTLRETPMSRIYADEIKGRAIAIYQDYPELQEVPEADFLNKPDVYGVDTAFQIHEFKNRLGGLIRMLGASLDEAVGELDDLHQYIVNSWIEACELKTESYPLKIALSIVEELDPEGSFLQISIDEMDDYTWPVDEKMVRGILMELIQNAIKHSELTGFGEEIEDIYIFVEHSGTLVVSNQANPTPNRIWIKNGKLVKGELTEGYGLSTITEKTNAHKISFNFDRPKGGGVRTEARLKYDPDLGVEYDGETIKICFVCHDRFPNRTFSEMSNRKKYPMIEASFGTVGYEHIDDVPEDTDLVIAHYSGGRRDLVAITEQLTDQAPGAMILLASQMMPHNHMRAEDGLTYRDRSLRRHPSLRRILLSKDLPGISIHNGLYGVTYTPEQLLIILEAVKKKRAELGL